MGLEKGETVKKKRRKNTNKIQIIQGETLQNPGRDGPGDPAENREGGWEWPLPGGLGMRGWGVRMEKRDQDWDGGPSEGAGVVLGELPQLLLLRLRLVPGDHQGVGIAHGHLLGVDPIQGFHLLRRRG